MGKVLHPDGKLCRCGCGQLAVKNVGPTGRNRGWYKYAEGHRPPPPLCDPIVRARAHAAKAAKIPVGSRRLKEVYGLHYWEVKVAGRCRWALEHRWVMEQFLGRPLLSSEHVHHKDGDGLNNDPDNLELMTAGDHRRLHSFRNPPLRCYCECPNCGARLDHFMDQGKRKQRKAK